jgi:transcriptional regulator with XRE-family HTH domain
MVTIAQVRGARGLLGWSQTALADAAGLSEPTIKRYETTVAKVSPEAVSKIVDALKAAAGIEFTNGGRPGVRLRKAK